jgi:hypothetical protein
MAWIGVENGSLIPFRIIVARAAKLGYKLQGHSGVSGSAAFERLWERGERRGDSRIVEIDLAVDIARFGSAV